MFVITPSGGRPESLALLDKYLQRQTFQNFKWIVLDDFADRSPKPERCDLHICPDWIWKGESTQAKSMIRLLEEVPENAKVVICEDDDYYSPEHLELFNYYLIDFDCVGQKNSVYFNIKNNTFKRFKGKDHACMCQTGFKGVLKDHLIDICTRYRTNLDVYFWRQGEFKRHLMDEMTCIGIKGQKGRGGLGIGHSMIGESGKLSDFIGEDENFYHCG